MNANIAAITKRNLYILNCMVHINITLHQANLNHAVKKYIVTELCPSYKEIAHSYKLVKLVLCNVGLIVFLSTLNPLK